MAVFSGVKVRQLNKEERNLPTNEENIPLVIEPEASGGTAFLNNFLAKNAEAIIEEITKNGAVLLRNFDVKSERDFEQAVASIEGLRPMESYFMSAPGRTLIEGAKFVFYTDKNVKTGGSLKFGGFHTENYYSPDVPGYICFCCLKPSTIGGETGLVDMGKVYEELDENLKKKLEAQSFTPSTYSVSSIAQRYNVSKQKVKKICLDAGFASFTTADGEEKLSFNKSSVFRHPVTKRHALASNFTSEIPKLFEKVSSELANDYSGWRWALHKYAWKNPFITRLAEERKKGIPALLIKKLLFTIGGLLKRNNNANKQYKYPANKMGSAFTEQEVNMLATLMHKHFTAFTWKKGDILLIDNLQMAHGGMPGFGPRTIRAMLCNPLEMDISASAPGRQSLTKNNNYQSLAERFERLVDVDVMTAKSIS
ncbi:MAG: TauD/TfdA family dioxygenase [Bacteroidota bacterium]|nr:TauD/TfdA family dioxygenase [Bacteroidota bacterium]